MTTGFITSGAVDVDTLLEPRRNWQFPGNLWVWGSGANGGLGLGNTNNVNSPVQLGSISNWSSVSLDLGGGLAVLVDGTLWAWGDDYNLGKLGLGATTNRSSPVQVGALTNWSRVFSVGLSSAAIKTDGTLWTWGFNPGGQLGQSNTTHRSSPVQVGSLTNWKYVAVGSGSAAARSMVAVKTDGTLWAWGVNASGQLGLGDATNRSSPVQVGLLTDWLHVSTNGHSVAAIKTDGSLWTWGNNPNGQLGLGDTTNRSSPVRVGALTNWKSITTVSESSTFGFGSVAAIKTDGTLWTWGCNSPSPSLGLGDVVNRSSPVQVGALTDWLYVAPSDRAFLAIKTDGTLWAWGTNGSGQLGLGDNSGRLSPVRVGSLPIWKSLHGGGALTF